MIINFSKLGPIQQVEIDTDKKMNIIVGANGTGKTYLSIFYYALLKYYSGNPINKISKEKINKFIESLLSGGKAEGSIPIKDIFNDFILSDKAKEITNHRDLDRLIADAFALQTTQKILSEVKISVKDFIKIQKKLESIHHRIKLNDDIEINKEETGDLNFKILNSEAVKKNLVIIVRIIAQSFERMLINNSFFFPAERGAINIFTKELSIKRNDLVEKLLELSSDDKKIDRTIGQAKRYTLPIRESLEFAYDIVQITKMESEFAHFADEIEEDLLNGYLKVDKHGQVLFTHNKSKTKPVPLDMAASSVKALASIVLYLRHKAEKGMTIFIDEPELNLHPNLQIQIARILVKMVNNGIKVFVSTHSDYIVRELNNMIIANEVNDDTIYDKSLHLKKADVDVTRLFYKRETSKKVVSERIKVERDGVSILTIDDVISKQNDDNDFLSEKLCEDESK